MELAVRARQLPKAFLLLGVALLLVSAACISADSEPAAEPTPEPATPAPSASPTATPAPTRIPASPQPTIPVPERTPAPTETPVPKPPDGEVVAMRLPSLGVEAAIERIGLVPGQNKLDVPEWYNIGWYDIYDKPGSGTSSLYAAHKDYWPDKRGPFYALTDLQNGDLITVVMGDGREYVYEVFFQRRYTKEDIPMYDLIWPHKARNPELLRPADEEWITLYTCGGDFVERTPGGAGYYLHRDVVIARHVETIPPQAVRAADEDQR